MFDRYLSTLLAATGALLYFSSPALAQDLDDAEYIEVAVDEEPREREDGLYGHLGVEASLNLVSNQNMVGQNDGMSILFGAGIDSGLDYVAGKNILRNTLSYNTSWTRTPNLELFVKNDDTIDLESLYNYYYLDWLGPFARFNLQTSAFRTIAITAEQRTYEIERTDGTIDTETRTRLPLAESFRPLSLFESVGVSAEPIRHEQLRTTFRLGFGARQTFAQGVLVIQDDPDTEDRIEVVELGNSLQAGAEGFAGIEGQLSERDIHYRFGATALIPFLNNDDTGRTAFELARLGVTANVRIGIFDWMGLTYRASVLRDPQLLDATQIQNSLLVTFNYQFVDTTAE